MTKFTCCYCRILSQANKNDGTATATKGFSCEHSLISVQPILTAHSHGALPTAICLSQIVDCMRITIIVAIAPCEHLGLHKSYTIHLL